MSISDLRFETELFVFLLLSGRQDSLINYLFCAYFVPGTVLSITDRQDSFSMWGPAWGLETQNKTNSSPGGEPSLVGEGDRNTLYNVREAGMLEGGWLVREVLGDEGRGNERPTQLQVSAATPGFSQVLLTFAKNCLQRGLRWSTWATGGSNQVTERPLSVGYRRKGRH